MYDVQLTSKSISNQAAFCRSTQQAWKWVKPVWGNLLASCETNSTDSYWKDWNSLTKFPLAMVMEAVVVSESDIYPEGCGFESQLRTGIVGGGSDEPVLSSTFKTTAEVRPLSNGTKPPTSPPIWLHTVCVYYCVCALGWVKCRAQILSMGHHTCSNLTFTLNATIHCYLDFYYTSMIKRTFLLLITHPHVVPNTTFVHLQNTN